MWQNIPSTSQTETAVWEYTYNINDKNVKEREQAMWK